MIPRPAKLAVGVAALSLLLVFPLVFTLPYPRDVMIRIFLYAMLATAWNVLGGYAGYVNFGSAAFFAVDKSEHSFHRSMCGANRLDGAERRSTGCDHIFYHGYVITFPERTFYELSRSVSFCLFSYGKCPQWMIGPGAGVADRVGNWISAKRKTANRINCPSRLMQS